MLTVAQRKRKRREHVELNEKIILQEKIQDEINSLGDSIRLKLLHGEPIEFAVRVCETCGFRAYNDKDLEHFYKNNNCHREILICQCCGKSSKRFTSEKHKVCTDCLGQSIDGITVREWSNSPIAFTISYPDGTTESFSSISEAVKKLNVPQTSLYNLVIGFWATYKGMTARVIPNIKTFDDLEALRASKRFR